MPRLLPFFAPLLLGALVCLYARFVEPNRPAVRRVRLDSGRRLNGGRPLRLALFSDLHYPRWSRPARVRRAIALSDRFRPDLVFVVGDLFDRGRHRRLPLPDGITAVFGGIESRLGVFAVLGNHDHWSDAPSIRRALASETDIRLLDNGHARLDLPGGPLYVVGVGDLWAKDVDYPRATAGVPEDAPVLLLSHNPDVVEEIRDPRIVAQFSGHTHGGQVRLPFVGALRVPSRFGNRYAQGLVTSGNHPVYVTRGVCSMRNVRFLCPPEVTWVELS
jgi:predicted MPP superfamily phosphohydrolase